MYDFGYLDFLFTLDIFKCMVQLINTRLTHSVCFAMSDPFQMPSVFEVFFWPFLMFIIFVVVIFTLLALIARYGKKAIGQTTLSAEVSQNQPVIEKEIIREIIKIRCPYCNGLYDEKLDKCPNCGARHP